ncbi:MAG TPA: GerMN domain-containing protein [Armatimonadota bacterium]|nr:GerMN domain-containing protein [Armatimonadota bacterium]
MRSILVALFLGVLAFVVGCTESAESDTMPRASVLVFRYDAARDVAVATTRPLAGEEAVTPQRYADALENYAEIMPTPQYRLADPRATVAEDVITVNYQVAATRGSLSSAQRAEARVTLEGWFWTPEVRQARFQVRGEPMALPELAPFPQPMPPAYHTYVAQPVTGEVMHLVDLHLVETLPEAISALQTRAISESAMTQGLHPLLPAGMTLAADPATIEDGVLTVNLADGTGRDLDANLAGMVLMLAQFPEVSAVQFTFKDAKVDRPFMRGNLNAPITPYQLLLPAEVATLATQAQFAAIQQAVQAEVGRVPVTLRALRVWRNWAAVAVTLEGADAQQTVLLQRDNDGTYAVRMNAVNPTAMQIRDALPADAIIALRLPGWDDAAKDSGL